VASASERLHLLYEVNRRLATFTELDELLRYATRRARELLNAEGCAILLLDEGRREFYFPVASQSESRKGAEARLGEIRFAADRGIAGWVLTHDEAALVPDVASDSRFYGEVDAKTDMRTRAVLCVPLRSRSGNIGVIEVINPIDGSFDNEDVEFLGAVAGDVAVAYEKAELYRQLHGEVIGLRQLCRVLGLGLVASGAVVSVWATIGHLGVSLPVGELLTRPRMLAGILAVVLGAVLVGVGQGWLIRRPAPLRA
jgi:GAF domain-containing protein